MRLPLDFDMNTHGEVPTGNGRMKIVHLIKHSLHGHGQVHVAVDLACLQARAGHRVAYASAGGSYAQLLENNGVENRYVEQGGSPLRLSRGILALLRLCRTFRPDVIHAHMMASAGFGFVASRLLGIPLITTVHNSFDRHASLMRLGHLAVGVSQAERKLLISRGFNPSRLRVVLNGPIGTPREEEGSEPVFQLARPCIATVAGLHPRKGVDILLDAFALLAPEFPNWHLNIIGKGPDQPKLERTVEVLKLQSNVHFLGSIAKPRLLLEQADIFATASRAEPFGLAVAEARAAGCAIVASRVGGIPEVLELGRAGILLDRIAPGDFAQALRHLMGDEKERNLWRTRSKENAAVFNADRVANEYLDVYREVCV